MRGHHSSFAWRAAESVVLNRVTVRANYIVGVLFALACACGSPDKTPSSTSPTTPKTAPPTETRTPDTTASTNACRADRVVPCQCARGKGYRSCVDGQLAGCVCKRAGNKRTAEPPEGPDPLDRYSRAADPTATPPDVKAPPPSATRTASGLAYRILKRGSGGRKPTATGRVTVHYSGWTTNGKLFDSSHKRARPSTFPLNRVIAGWTEGLQLMSTGDKFRFWMPQHIAYKGVPRRPMGMLVFDVEMITVH